MSQYADGGKVVMKRPYLSTSKYLMRLGGYRDENGWAEIWDSLYYLFIEDHQDLLAKNYSLAPHVNRWRKMEKKQRENYIRVAKRYLASLSTT